VRPLRVVIVGGGFGGMTAAKALARLPVEITLIDRHNFHTFSPLLYQVATSGLAPDDISPSLRGIVQGHANVDAVMAEVRGVDLERREVLVERGAAIAYDVLVLAAGAVSSDFGVPGVREHAIPLKSLDDAIRVRSAVLRRFEEANTDRSLLDEAVVVRRESSCVAHSPSSSRRCSRKTSRTSMSDAHASCSSR